MASAVTTTAFMAAAGFDKRRPSNVSSLQTPGSGTFPSEMLSPLAGSPGLPHKDDLKTPITPPSAYLDFLRNMSPAMLSPAPTSAGGRFGFGDKSFEKAFESGPDGSLASPPASRSTSQPKSQPASIPPLSRNTSSDSTTSHASTSSTTSNNRSTTSTAARSHRPQSPRVVIPPASPFVRPGPRSARTPRRLHIPPPQSPYSQPPGSAHSVPSPYSNTPVCSTPWSASFSPRGGEHDVDAAMAKPGKVSVRHVVTRTVTYCRTPLEPAPKGKRRKIEVESESTCSGKSSAAATAGASGEEERRPAIKRERIDEDEEVVEDENATRTPRAASKEV